VLGRSGLFPLQDRKRVFAFFAKTKPGGTAESNRLFVPFCWDEKPFLFAAKEEK